MYLSVGPSSFSSTRSKIRFSILVENKEINSISLPANSSEIIFSFYFLKSRFIITLFQWGGAWPTLWAPLIVRDQSHVSGLQRDQWGLLLLHKTCCAHDTLQRWRGWKITGDECCLRRQRYCSIFSPCSSLLHPRFIMLCRVQFQLQPDGCHEAINTLRFSFLRVFSPTLSLL